MTHDSSHLPAGASSSLVADYLVDLLRSMSALADAADLNRSKAAIDGALEVVLAESSGRTPARARSAG
ncbi:MAG: hypothetical protein ACQRW7_03165 [Caulobacterales bacterium]|uniref:hypothetical protein n=1 Tax=Glycocaulis sp. TaxID=1969725 RepID=UPI003FA09871